MDIYALSFDLMDYFNYCFSLKSHGKLCALYLTAHADCYINCKNFFNKLREVNNAKSTSQ